MHEIYSAHHHNTTASSSTLLHHQQPLHHNQLLQQTFDHLNIHASSPPFTTNEHRSSMDDFDSFLIGHQQMADFQPMGNSLDAATAGSGMMVGPGGARDNRQGLDGSGSHLTPMQFKSPSPALPTGSSPSQQPQHHLHPHSHHTHPHSLPTASTASNMYGITQTTATGLAGAPDPFGDLLSDFWIEQEHSQGGSPARSSTSVPPPDVNHPERLLSFRTHQSPSVALFDAYSQPTQINLSAQLHGMFFLAESPWDATGSGSLGASGISGLGGQPKELTCYRRNLFQISGTVTIPKIHSIIVGNPSEDGGDIIDGKKRQIQALEATISGIESVEGNSVKIITVPWKSAANASTASTSNQQTTSNSSTGEEFPTPSRAPEKEPAPIFLNYTPAYNAGGTPSGPTDDDSEPFSYPLNWKRLQFRSATANNGRRKDLQQHFLVRIAIVATLFPENGGAGMGEKVSLCEAFSGAIIVRGRSPRNFSSRNDIPLSGSAASSARHNKATSETTGKRMRQNSNPLPPFEGPEKKIHRLSHDPSSFPLPMHQSPDLIGTPFNANPAMTEGMYASNLWAQETDWMQVNTPPVQQQQPLKQEDGDYNQNRYAMDQSHYGDYQSNPSRLSVSGYFQAMRQQRSIQQMHDHVHQRSSDKHPILTPKDPLQRITVTHTRDLDLKDYQACPSPGMDLLYEYFPIGVDDWLPPVDVVYRPHAAHHMTQVASKGSGRSKRLFSETPFE